MERAKRHRQDGIAPSSKEANEFYEEVESLAEDYEWLITDSNMRDYGRDMEADRYL